MKFKSISIVNFRNFEDITISLSNKNLFFGLNDVGKTNFMFALRYVFDHDTRKINLIDSDFHCKKTDTPIEIIVSLDISDVECDDTQKLRAGMKGALLSSHNTVYIKLKAEYNSNEAIALPVLYWGGETTQLYEMKQRGSFSEIDFIFNTVYIDAYTDLYKLFKKNVNSLVKSQTEDDRNTFEEIEEIVDELNGKIGSLSGIKSFEKRIEPEYKKFRNDDISITIKSELAVTGVYANVVPYIKHKDDCNLYPTSGEGRRKVLVYSIYDLLASDMAERKINLFLIEEPENHLHKTLQIALSKILFSNDVYQYLFVTTHSPYILYEMEDVNLVRIYNKTKINSASVMYTVPQEYKELKNKLNKDLAEALFSDKVLLVEGESEVLLLTKVLSSRNPFFEVDGICILSVDGIGFVPYFRILDALEITNIIKTDNDLKYNPSDGKYSVTGFSRCNNFIGKSEGQKLPIERINQNSVAAKRTLHNDNIKTITYIADRYKVYLSRCDLENDLDEVIHIKLVQYLGTENTVDYLQSKKKYNMVELVEKLSSEDCEAIYLHENFACLKRVLQ